MEKLYTMKEASEILLINVNAMNDLRRAGLIRCMKLGSYKVREAELDRFIREAEGKDFSDLENIVDLKVGDNKEEKTAS